MIKVPNRRREPRQWQIVMVDTETGDRTVAPKTVSTEEAMALFRTWEAEELDSRRAVAMFWPAAMALPRWLEPS
ncbi:MAG: hypothetical protein IT422_03160 [Pirellulaceae bacterium]|nr:hypothetical protein [Pirellulaceae bacterium]